jgi:hypothetical protein
MSYPCIWPLHGFSDPISENVMAFNCQTKSYINTNILYEISYMFQTYIGIFAETANVKYRLSFADLGKQTSVFHIYTVYIYLYIHILKRQYIYKYLYLYTYIYAAVSNGKRNEKAVYHLLTVQMEVCRLSVRLRRNKLKLSVCKWTKQKKQTK